MGLFSKKNKAQRRPRTAAVIAAAGLSSRMGGVNKLFAPVCGVPVIAHTLMAFERCASIDEIIVVTTSESIIPVGDICKEYGITKATHILCGGAERMDSVYAALLNVRPETEYVAIHDGARPLVRPELIAEVLECAYIHGASAPVVPIKDTIKVMDGTVIVTTADREKFGAVQTPQAFQLPLIKGALSKAVQDGVKLTDDCAALERMGMKIQSVAGYGDNIKITTPEDLTAAEAFMSQARYW